MGGLGWVGLREVVLLCRLGKLVPGQHLCSVHAQVQKRCWGGGGCQGPRQGRAGRTGRRQGEEGHRRPCRQVDVPIGLLHSAALLLLRWNCHALLGQARLLTFPGMPCLQAMLTVVMAVAAL